jgi:hypothetical protein
MTIKKLKKLDGRKTVLKKPTKKREILKAINK